MPAVYGILGITFTRTKILKMLIMNTMQMLYSKYTICEKGSNCNNFLSKSKILTIDSVAEPVPALA